MIVAGTRAVRCGFPSVLGWFRDFGWNKLNGARLHENEIKTSVVEKTAPQALKRCGVNFCGESVRDLPNLSIFRLN